MSTQLIPVAPDRDNAVFHGLRDAFDGRMLRGAVLIAGVAYATREGVTALIAALESAGTWAAIQKRIIIGVHQGITEPAALELLLTLPKSDIRAFVPKGTLDLGALTRVPVFHPKFFAVTGSSVHEIGFIQVGSANLSGGAMGRRARNCELSVSLGAAHDVSERSRQDFGNWWSKLWKSSRKVDQRFIASYAKLRLQVLDRNPIIRQIAGTPIGIHTAGNFFVEVGAASGPPGLRHQVEFPRNLAAFFGRPTPGKRLLTLNSHASSWPNRPLSHKKTTYNVEIWRLGMPTQAAGGVPIAERAIKFKKTADPDRFEFRVADVGDATFAKWNQQANLSGHVGATQGSRPRLYGFY